VYRAIKSLYQASMMDCMAGTESHAVWTKEALTLGSGDGRAEPSESALRDSSGAGRPCDARDSSGATLRCQEEQVGEELAAVLLEGALKCRRRVAHRFSSGEAVCSSHWSRASGCSQRDDAMRPGLPWPGLAAGRNTRMRATPSVTLAQDKANVRGAFDTFHATRQSITS